LKGYIRDELIPRSSICQSDLWPLIIEPSIWSSRDGGGARWKTFSASRKGILRNVLCYFCSGIGGTVECIVCRAEPDISPVGRLRVYCSRPCTSAHPLWPASWPGEGGVRARAAGASQSGLGRVVLGDLAQSAMEHARELLRLPRGLVTAMTKLLLTVSQAGMLPWRPCDKAGADATVFVGGTPCRGPTARAVGHPGPLRPSCLYSRSG
jgi:hypothetical protein